MNLKILGGIVLGIVLAFVAGFGLSSWNSHKDKENEKKLEGVVTTIVQNTLTESFKNINADYKDEIKKSIDQYLADKKTADDANRLLNNNQPSWVWVKPTDSKPAADAKAGTPAAGPKPAETVRAQLSDRTSVPLREGAKRADQCAVDYNKLRADYDALWLSVYHYNQTVDVYNSQFQK